MTEPYAVSSLVRLAETCCGGTVPGAVEGYELLREAWPWLPGDTARYRYTVRWSNCPDQAFTYTSSQLAPWVEAGDG